MKVISKYFTLKQLFPWKMGAKEQISLMQLSNGDRPIVNPSMNPSTAAKQYFCKGRGPKEWSWNHFNTPCQQIQFNMELEWCPGLIHYDHIGQMLYSGLYISLDVLQS